MILYSEVSKTVQYSLIGTGPKLVHLSRTMSNFIGNITYLLTHVLLVSMLSDIMLCVGIKYRILIFNDPTAHNPMSINLSG